MNVFEYAMQMEKDGEKFYRELAGDCKTEGIKTILVMLADEEAKHFNIIVQMQKHAEKYPLVKTKILENVKNVFITMKEEKVDMRFDSSDLELYRKAMTIEEESRKFYQNKADNAGKKDVKQTFLRLSGEEKKHFQILENIVEFVARPEPGNWLENAEWHHLDEY
jgi:rubrerythrin